MTPPRRNITPGIVLIALGLIFLLPNFTPLQYGQLWPLIMIGMGCAFFLAWYANRENYGMIMPGTILTVIGLVMFYSVVEGWYQLRELWPFFIIGPGLGFILMYLLGKRERGLLIPGGILLLIGVMFLAGLEYLEYVLPATLIIIGLVVLLNAFRNNPDS